MIQPKNLLIVRTDRIGDVVLSLPLARIIKKQYPECKVTFLLKEYTKCLAEQNPFIDQIIVLKEKEGKILIKKNIDEISKFRFDSAVIVYPTFITSLVIFLSQIKYRIGTGYRWYSLLFNHKIYEHRKFAEKHELEFNVNLLRAFGINEEVNEENIQFDLIPNINSKNSIDKLFLEEEISSDKPIIVIHPGSGGSAVDWPIDQFQKLVRLITSKMDATIIITGSSDELAICKKLEVNNAVKNFAGKFDLSDLIAIIDKSDIFISNSTGPIHIAVALGKYTIGFYPKILSCSPQRWGPYTKRKFIFTPQIECANCDRKQCEELDCMGSIKPEEVFNQIEKVYQFILNNGEFDV